MGKSNRVRAERATNKVAAPVKIKTKKKQGMPLWLKTLIAAVMAVVVLGVCVFGVLSANGVIMRYRTAIKSDHYTVSGNMMSYFYQLQYQSFYNQYSSYMSYFSLDTTKSLKEQNFGEAAEGGYAYETSFLGEFDGTWFDYFMSKATEQVEQLLVYCEEAYERDITLDDEDLEELDTTIETLKSAAEQQSVSVNTYVSSMYGTGVSVNDVKKALKLTLLAEKCMVDLQDEILEGISDSDIETEYNNNKIDFDVIDYTYYTLKVDYEEIVKEILGDDYTEAELKDSKDKVLAEYAKQINEAKAVADEMKALKSEAEFNKYLYEYLAEEYCDEALAELDVESEKLPDDTVKEAVKTALIESIVTDVVAEKEEATGDSTNSDDKYTLYTYEVTKEYAEAIDEVKISVFESILSDKETYIVEKANYAEDDDFFEWAFEDGRKAGDTKTVLEGDGSEGSDVSDDDGYFNASVYFLTVPQRCDEMLTKDVIYMVFTSEDLAKEAIEKIKSSTLSVEEFKAIAEELEADACNDYEDYVEGSLGVDSFDTWLFADDTAKGDYTETPLAADSSSFVVAYYYDDGAPAWKVSVESSIFADRFEEKFTSMESAYSITVKDKVLSKIGE